jgi:hypothetical protein
LCKILGIEKTRTCAYNPKSDGQVERFNATLESMLSMYIKENQKDWDQYLYLVTMAYRSTIHETTKFTPNKLMLGKEITLPIDLMVGKPTDDEGEAVESVYVQELQEEMVRAHDIARQNARQSNKVQKQQYDRKAYGHIYEPGDFVWLYTPVRQLHRSTKLLRWWTGPFLITDRLSDVTYRIQKSKGAQSKVVHFDRLKPYRGRARKSWLKE